MISRREFLAGAVGAAALRGAGNSHLVYWGTYTSGGGQFGNGESKGIYLSRFNSDTGALTEPELVAESVNPSWLLLSPNKRYLFAVNELVNGKDVPTGELSSFSVDAKTGKLTAINRVSSKGGQPCHLCTNRAGTMLLTANWYTGSAAGVPIGRDGRLGESTVFLPQTAEKAGGLTHTHSVFITPDDRFLISTNTALNRIFVYKTKDFSPNDPAGLTLSVPSNPRHFNMHPNGKWAYIANENRPACTLLRYNAAQGSFEEGPACATLPPDTTGRSSSAEVFVHPGGKFVYQSNRGHNSITAMRVNQDDGSLTLIEVLKPGGETPRSFRIDPTGRFLIAMMQRTGSIEVLKIDAESGKLTPTDVKRSLPYPVCAIFL